MSRIISSHQKLFGVLALLLMLYAPSAFAACSSPAGNEGDIVYDSTNHLMDYCNGLGWITMGQTNSISFGTLTAGDLCWATSGTAIACTGTLSGDVTSTGGSALTTTVVSAINGVALGTTTATAGNLLIGSGTKWVSNGVTGDVTINSIGVTTIGANRVTVGDIAQIAGLSVLGNATSSTANVSAITGTANQTLMVNSAGTALAFGTLGVAGGGTGAITLTAHGVVLGNGTSAVNVTSAGTTGYLLTGAGTLADPTFSQLNLATSPAITGTLPIGNGGTGQATALAARSSTGLDIEEMTIHGDSAYTIVATDQTVATSAALTAARTWTLPAASAVNAGQKVCVVDQAGGVTATNTLTISRAGSDTVNGGTTYVLKSAYGSTCLASDGSSKWTTVGGGGTPAGSTTQVQYNNSGAFGADANFTYNGTGTLTLGVASGSTGTLALAGTTSGTVTIAPQAAAGTYNFNLPTSAGSAGQPLLSGAGGATAMTFGTLGIGAGGTGQTTAAAARASTGLNIDEMTTHGDSAYTILAIDRVVATNATLTAARIWTLPAANAVNAGQKLCVVDQAGGVTATNTLTVSRAGADTVNGGTTFVLNTAYGSICLASDGSSKWTTVSNGTGSSSSTINSGTQYQMAYYAANGTVLSGDSNITTDASNNLIIGSGKIAIGANFTPTKDLSFDGQSARTLWVERDTTASTAGQSLTVQAGGAKSGGTDLNGGNLLLSSGISTGTNTSNIQLQVYPAAASTGSSDNTATTALTVSETGTAAGGTGSFGNLVSTVQSTAASGTDKNGANLNIASGVSTGTGTSGINFKVYSAGSTGATANATTTAMTITSAGNVGIGSTSPNYALDVNTGTVGGTIMHIIPQAVAVTPGGSTGGLTLNTAATGQMAYYSNASTISGTNDLYVSSSNIGIGTTSPAVLNTGGSPDLDIHNNSAGYSELDLSSTATANNAALGIIDFGTLGNSAAEHRSAAILSSLTATSTTNISAYLSFYTNNVGTLAERMRIDNAGNVGIGTTVPTSKLDVEATTNQHFMVWNGTNLNIGAQTDGGAAYTNLQLNASNILIMPQGGDVGIGTTVPGALLEIAASTAPNEYIHYTGAAAAGNKGELVFTHNRNSDNSQEILGYIQGVAENNQSNGGMRFVARTGSDLEVMRINSSGDVLINETSAASVEKFGLSYNGVSQYGMLIKETSNGSGYPMLFYEGATQSGTIFTNGGATTYNTTSDRRLKENISITRSGLDDLMKVQVDDFNFIADPKKHRIQGFIAQDLYTIYPEAVSKGSDDVKKMPWSVDYGRVTPLIVKAVQDLKVLFDTLAADLATIKNHLANDVDPQLAALKADNESLRAIVEKQGREIEALKKVHP